VISTGDELLEPGEALKPGAIRDSNRLLLSALLEECGVSVVRSARVPDDPGRVAEAIRAALGVADVVLTIGGISAGDFDPVKQSLAGISGLALWRVAMKPGRPQAFGAPEGRLFFGLPGNPASVACTFEALVRPALRKKLGYAALDRPRLPVRAATAIESRVGRVDFVRATLERRADGWWASPAGSQVSGHLAPQSRAHVLLIVDAERESLAEGDTADALLLRWPETDAS
jgi:molybdopterin molybdotransferase